MVKQGEGSMQTSALKIGTFVYLHKLAGDGTDESWLSSFHASVVELWENATAIGATTVGNIFCEGFPTQKDARLGEEEGARILSDAINSLFARLSPIVSTVKTMRQMDRDKRTNTDWGSTNSDWKSKKQTGNGGNDWGSRALTGGPSSGSGGPRFKVKCGLYNMDKCTRKSCNFLHESMTIQEWGDYCMKIKNPLLSPDQPPDRVTKGESEATGSSQTT